MPVKELKTEYGVSTSRQAYNAAIRAEIPGGAAALDRLETWHHICNRLGWEWSGRGDMPLHLLAYKHLLEIVDAMEDRIRRKYDCPPREERMDLKRG
jgi:dissimilatory sulfite reductase (desulfoviridin) alpha/beta subunit